MYKDVMLDGRRGSYEARHANKHAHIYLHMHLHKYVPSTCTCTNTYTCTCTCTCTCAHTYTYTYTFTFTFTFSLAFTYTQHAPNSPESCGPPLTPEPRDKGVHSVFRCSNSSRAAAASLIAICGEMFVHGVCWFMVCVLVHCVCVVLYERGRMSERVCCV